MSDREQSRQNSEPFAQRAVRSIVLAWTDAETGEHVLVDVRGDPDGLAGIESSGFAVLRAEGASLAARATPTKQHAVSGDRSRRRAARTDDPTARGATDGGAPRRPWPRAEGA